MIYIDDMQMQARVGRLDAKWSHLTADTKEELHDFAEKLGLRRSWFQDKPRGLWHYDVTEPKRQMAIRLGAEQIRFGDMDDFQRVFRRPGREGVPVMPSEPIEIDPGAVAAHFDGAAAGLYEEHRAIPSMQRLAETATQFVPGEGDLSPLVMLVGEAPGADEDREGRPFVGRAGTLLRKVLDELGIDTQRFWITNLIKFRPVDADGKNRTPTDLEIQASAPFLHREIELLDPVIVVTLGNTPTRALWPTAPGISQIHGRPRVDSGGKYVHLPAYHPSYALRAPENEQALRRDLRMLRKLLAELEPAEPPAIRSFSGPYRFLGNFYPAEVEWQLTACPTVEHAFQAAKTSDFEVQAYVMAAPTPIEAKRRGWAVACRSDWEQIKTSVMLELVRQKFDRHPELREKLLATGDAHLEEGNTWDDRIWGTVNGEGENRLGKILMQVRDEIRQTEQGDPS